MQLSKVLSIVFLAIVGGTVASAVPKRDLATEEV